MEKQTRTKIIKEKRNELIAKVYNSGDFLLEEVAKMFNRGIGTIFRIVKKVEKKSKK